MNYIKAITLDKMKNMMPIMALAGLLVLILMFSTCKVSAVDKDVAKELKLGVKTTETVTTDGEGNFKKTYYFNVPKGKHLINLIGINKSFTDHVMWWVYDSTNLSDGRPICQLSRNKNEGERDQGVALPVKPGHKYYIEVRYGYGQSSPFLDSHPNETGTYETTVKVLPDKEPSHYTAANVVKLNQAISGVLDDDHNDQDWFKFTAPKSGYYRIKKYSNVMKLLDKDIKELDNSRYTVTYSNSKYNERYQLKMIKGEVLYIEYFGTMKKYGFIIREGKVKKPGAAVIKSVKVKKRSLTVKYKTVKNATQYQIAVQKKGAKKWKLYISKKLSKKVTKLAKGKKYNVKVRGVTREDVDTYYGKWSKTKTVKVR